MSDGRQGEASTCEDAEHPHPARAAKIVLELYAVDFRLDGLQAAVDIEPADFNLDERGKYRETRELNLWLSIEHARCSLDVLVTDRLRWASRLPENFPAKQPRDFAPLGVDVKLGSGRPMRKARKRPD